MITKEDRKAGEEEEAKSRSIFDPVNQKMSLANRRATDLRENTKVHLPKAMSNKEESKQAVRLDNFKEEFKQYRRENCKGKDNSKQSINLTKEQKTGLDSIKKRVAEGDLVVCPTDKSGKWCLTKKETYLKMGSVHTSKDRIIGKEVIRENKRLLNGHMSMFNKCFKTGQRWNHQERVRETTLEDSNSVPPLYLLIKDHKKRMKGCLPATRQVVGNNKSMGVHLSNATSDIVEGLGVVMDDGFGAISTEDLLSRFDEYNQAVKEGKICDSEKRFLTGADAIALFPSMDPDKCAKIVGDEYVNSNMKIGDIDYECVGKYIAMNWNRG